MSLKKGPCNGSLGGSASAPAVSVWEAQHSARAACVQGTWQVCLCPSSWVCPGCCSGTPQAQLPQRHWSTPGTAEGPSCPYSPSSATKMPPTQTCSCLLCFPCCPPQHFSEFMLGLWARTPQRHRCFPLALFRVTRIPMPLQPLALPTPTLLALASWSPPFSHSSFNIDFPSQNTPAAHSRRWTPDKSHWHESHCNVNVPCSTRPQMMSPPQTHIYQPAGEDTTNLDLLLSICLLVWSNGSGSNSMVNCKPQPLLPSFWSTGFRSIFVEIYVLGSFSHLALILWSCHLVFCKYCPFPGFSFNLV